MPGRSLEAAPGACVGGAGEHFPLDTFPYVFLSEEPLYFRRMKIVIYGITSAEIIMELLAV